MITLSGQFCEAGVRPEDPVGPDVVDDGGNGKVDHVVPGCRAHAVGYVLDIADQFPLAFPVRQDRKDQQEDDDGPFADDHEDPVPTEHESENGKKDQHKEVKTHAGLQRFRNAGFVQSGHSFASAYNDTLLYQGNNGDSRASRGEKQGSLCRHRRFRRKTGGCSGRSLPI